MVIRLNFKKSSRLLNGCVGIVFGITLIYSITVLAVTPDELRRLSGEAERKKHEKDRYLKVNDLTGILPEKDSKKARIDKKKPLNKTTTKQPISSKYKNNSVEKSSINVPVTNASVTKKTTHNKHIDNEEADNFISSRSSHLGFDTAKANSPYFGIRIGTWFRGRLNRSTTNTETGKIEITVSADVNGDRKVLPAGSTLFGNKSFNRGTQKLEIAITNGITVDGMEFNVSGLVFDINKSAGLSGIISVDNDGVVGRGISKSSIAFGRAGARLLAQGNPLGEVAAEGAESMFSDAGKIDNAKHGDLVTVFTSPQDLYIRVEKTF